MLDPTLPADLSKASLDGASSPLPLEIRGLVYETGGKRLIDNIDARIEERGITVIMGPNGAGKSVLLRLMHGLIPPSRGEILWPDGEQAFDRLVVRPWYSRSRYCFAALPQQISGMPWA